MKRNDNKRAINSFTAPPIDALLEAFHQNFQPVMEVITCGLYLIDPEGRIVYWNEPAETVTGLSATDVIGKPCRKIFRCEQQGCTCSLDKQNSSIGRTLDKEVALEINGSLCYLHKKSNPIHSPQGEWIGTAVSFIDLTAQREAELAILEAHELIESTRRAKRHFMANMSHEIRTPINGIMGVLDLLVTGVTTPVQRDHLLTARKSARLLMNLIGDLLDFSTIDKGEALVEQTGFSLRSVIASVIARQYDLTRNKAVAIKSFVADEVPDNLLGDPGRLYQILKHVVGNGIKFTSAGEVTVRVKTAEAVKSAAAGDQRHSIVHFSVSDTGIGIPREKLNSIFEVFSQVDASATRTAGGLGIGLNIVNRLVEIMGGHIWIESKPGKGTMVHFALPFKRAFDEEEMEEAIDPEASDWEPAEETRELRERPSSPPLEEEDTDPAPVEISADWLSRYDRVRMLIQSDPKKAESTIKELRGEIDGTLANTLFRLLIAVRRENETRIKQHMDTIDTTLGRGKAL